MAMVPLVLGAVSMLIAVGAADPAADSASCAADARDQPTAALLQVKASHAKAGAASRFKSAGVAAALEEREEIALQPYPRGPKPPPLETIAGTWKGNLYGGALIVITTATGFGGWYPVNPSDEMVRSSYYRLDATEYKVDLVEVRSDGTQHSHYVGHASDDNRLLISTMPLRGEFELRRYSSQYHTAPEGNQTCDFGVSPQEEACEAAGEEILGWLGQTALRPFKSGSWNHVPSGCSIQSGNDWTVHFNSYAGWNTGLYSRVCTNIAQCGSSSPTILRGEDSRELASSRGLLAQKAWDDREYVVSGLIPPEMHGNSIYFYRLPQHEERHSLQFQNMVVGTTLFVCAERGQRDCEYADHLPPVGFVKTSEAHNQGLGWSRNNDHWHIPDKHMSCWSRRVLSPTFNLPEPRGSCVQIVAVKCR